MDLRRIYERYRQPKGRKLKDLAAVKHVAEQLVTRAADYDLFRATLASVGIPLPVRNPIEAHDYPHWDMTYPESAVLIQKRQDLSEDAKRKILCDNAYRFYPSLTKH